MLDKAVLSLCLASAFAAGASFSTPVAAQGVHAGTWTVTAAVRPDWIEPTSPEPARPAEIGAEVTFAPGGVTGDETLACTDATYSTPTLKGDEIFGSGIVDPAALDRARSTFALPQYVQVMRVDCAKGVFDYHQADADTLVVMFDNLVYTLKRKAAKRR